MSQAVELAGRNKRSVETWRRENSGGKGHSELKDYVCFGERRQLSPQRLIIIQPILDYLNPAASVCEHIPGGTRVAFITSKRSCVRASAVILVVADTNYSRQWRARKTEAATVKRWWSPGKEQSRQLPPCILELGTKFTPVASLWCRTFVKRHCTTESTN